MRPSESLRSLRAFGVVAHVDAGKTTLSERVLFHTGRIHRVAEVHEGAATTDATAIERRRGISIHAAAIHCTWDEHPLTLVDTPGHVDFTVEVERSLRVLDGAVLVLCAVGGVQAQTLSVFRQMRRYGVPSVAFINKCDRPGADPARVVNSVTERLGVQSALLQLPIGSGETLSGVVDLISMRALRFEGRHGEQVLEGPVPAELQEAAMRARAQLLETVSLHSDALLSALVEERPVSQAQLCASIREATLSGAFIPALVGSAYRDVGVQPVLDAVVRYLPAPEERLHATVDAAHEPGPDIRVDASAPTLAFAFKRQELRHGALSWIRLYQGRLQAGDVLWSRRSGEAHRVQRLLRLDAGGVSPVSEAVAGEIVALPGVGLSTGDTLAAEGCALTLPGLELPVPVVEVAASLLEGKVSRLSTALRSVAAEDPTFQVSMDAESGELRLRGMGELHLEVICERLREDHGLVLRLGAPHVALRHTLAAPVAFDLLHKKQGGGPGQYARVVGRVEPIEGMDVTLQWDANGEALPQIYRGAIEKAARHLMDEGLEDGIPWVGVRVVLTDGATHVQDSSDLAFYLATRAALREALSSAAPVVLEPRMRVEVEAPGEDQGQVFRTLISRRGQVLGSETHAESVQLTAEVPLSEMFGYANGLRSVTRGAGSFRMSFARYAAR
ncbi:MAG: elongation factor G [Alphaproteobacteria bacterium]|nr:elongation factor G [Alphaproteobacteria bacterium]MCB9793615.1 elongation factor G [Alphaproteobacteria bacterium]